MEIVHFDLCRLPRYKTLFEITPAVESFQMWAFCELWPNSTTPLIESSVAYRLNITVPSRRRGFTIYLVKVNILDRHSLFWRRKAKLDFFVPGKIILYDIWRRGTQKMKFLQRPVFKRYYLSVLLYDTEWQNGSILFVTHFELIIR